MKRIICFLVVLVLCISFSVPVFADFGSSIDENNSLSISTDDTRAEETVWYYRIYDNLYQKRLWSITYGYWKTDWITIGYVP